MLGYIGCVYRYLPSHVKNGIVILLCIFESIITVTKPKHYHFTILLSEKCISMMDGFKDLIINIDELDKEKPFWYQVQKSMIISS